MGHVTRNVWALNTNSSKKVKATDFNFDPWGRYALSLAPSS